MNLIKNLKNLGLNEKEAKVYLALLQLGQSTAYVVADRAEIKKPTTYVILKQLVEKGFVRNVPRDKKQLFVAEPPEDVVSVAEEKFLSTKQALPELLALRKNKSQKTSVAYFEGMSGVKESYKRLFKVMKTKPEAQREYVAFYAHAGDTPQELLPYFDDTNEMHRKLNIRRRGITVYHPTIIQKYLNEEVLRSAKVKMKALSEDKYSSRISIEVFDRYVHIFSHRYLQVTVIDNPDVADVMRQIFEIVWNLVEKDKKTYLKYSNTKE